MGTDATSLDGTAAGTGHRLAIAAWLLAGGYLVLLSWFCLAPDPWWVLTLFGVPGREMETAVDSTLADYVQHGLSFAVLSVLVYLARGTTHCPTVFWCGLSLAIYALSMEWLQAFVPMRTFALGDGLANLFGGCIGWLAAAWARAFVRNRPRIS